MNVAVAIIAVLLGWLGLVQPVSAAPAAARQMVSHSYDSDQHHPGAGGAVFQRGPPTISYSHTTHLSAVDPASYGPSVRPRSATTLTSTTYDHAGGSAQPDSRRATAWATSDGLAADARTFRGTRSAANAVPKALPSGPKIKVQWGADTYRHGGLMSTIEHISYRYAYNSGFSGSAGTPKKRR